MTDLKLQVIPLGGLGEFGMNMTAIRYGDDIIVVDCGMMFPDAELLGVDIVMPDLTYPEGKPGAGPRPDPDARPRRPHRRPCRISLRDRRAGLRHGVHAGPGGAAAGRARSRAGAAADQGQAEADRSSVGPFKIEFIHVTHSIVSCVALAITTPLGVIIHTGDFKVDPTPTDNELFDLHTLADYGKRGVLLLLSDSTNADRPGYTESERAVRPRMEEIFSRAEKRLVVSCFSSSIHRIQQMLDLAQEYGRKVAVIGRSMMSVTEIAHYLGLLTIPDGILLRPQDVMDAAAGEGGGPGLRHAGRADVGAVARGRGQSQAHLGRDGRYGGAELAHHPRKRKGDLTA